MSRASEAYARALKWEDVTDEQLAQWNDAGESQGAIARRLGVSQARVWARIQRARGTTKRPVKRWPSAHKLAAEYEQGATYQEIADKHGMSLSTARRLIRSADGKAS